MYCFFHLFDILFGYNGYNSTTIVLISMTGAYNERITN